MKCSTNASEFDSRRVLLHYLASLRKNLSEIKGKRDRSHDLLSGIAWDLYLLILARRIFPPQPSYLPRRRSSAPKVF